MQVVEREVALLPGQLDQLAEFFLLFRSLGEVGNAVGGRIGGAVGGLRGFLLHRHQFGFGRLIPRARFRIRGGRNFGPAGTEFRSFGSLAFGDFLHAENHSPSTKKASNINIKN